MKMTIEYLIKGLIIGISVAAPVGPIGILTIKRTLNEGRLSGFITGMGAAVADTLYGIIAGFGLSSISAFLLTQIFWLKFIGGLFLFYLGVKFFKTKSLMNSDTLKHKSLLNNFISTFFLTLTNPTTILSFIAIFASLGIGITSADYISSMTFVFGVFIGSSIWWLILSYIVAYFKTKITSLIFNWINRVSGLIIISFALYALITCLA